MALEIERRWKLKGEIPEDYKEKKTIEQVYAHFSPDVRIRKLAKDESITFFHTVKYQLKDNTREEMEHRISKDRYEKIFEVIDKKPVIKDRYVIELDNGLHAEVDHFLDTDDKIVEVEFPNEETMNNFEKPDWFGTELKKNKSFSAMVFAKINNMNKSVWSDI